MKHKGTLICAAAVLAMAATTGAQAGRTLSKQHQAELARKQASQRSFVQPRTMKDAERTQERAIGGGSKVAVPETLFNQMYVTKNAEGQLVVREADASVDVSTIKQEELAHE